MKSFKSRVFTMLVTGIVGAGMAVVMAVSPAAADSVTWTGLSQTSSNWSDPANWSPRVPTSGDSVAFPKDAPRIGTSTNDLADLSLTSLSFTGKGHVLAGNPLALSGGLSVGGDYSDFTGPDYRAVTISLPIRMTADQTWRNDIYNSAVQVSIDGIVSGTSRLTIDGLGEIQLTADNSYSGDTVVRSGTLRIMGNQPNSRVVTLLGTALYAGYGPNVTGTGRSGALQLAKFGTLLPGPDGGHAGTFHTGDASLERDSLFAFYAHDNAGNPLDVTGTVSVDNAYLMIAQAHDVAVGKSWFVIRNDGADPIVGQFHTRTSWVSGEGSDVPLPEGTVFPGPFPDFNLKISYVGGDGNDVTLTAVAPPGPTTTSTSSTTTSTTSTSTTSTTTTTVPNPVAPVCSLLQGLLDLPFLRVLLVPLLRTFGCG